MKAKNLLIPVAAFAVTVTGVQAFNSEVLQNAGLSDDQITAFEEARELREDGDKEGAKNLLIEAGVDQETMEKVREAMREHREEHREAIQKAIENDDYNAFKEAIEGTPLTDIITNQSDFEQFAEAHKLIIAGDKEEAKELFADLGLERPGHGPKGFKGRNIENAPFWDELSSSEQAAIKAAIEAKDKEEIKAILEAAGIERPNLGRSANN